MMDNVSFHKSVKVKEFIKKVGCRLIYLPTYSPDFNLIEHCLINFKNYLRKIIKKFDDVHDLSLQPRPKLSQDSYKTMDGIITDGIDFFRS